MPRRFEEALEATAAFVDRDGREADRAAQRRGAAMGGVMASWCGRLAASPVPPSLDHNDLHPWNILGYGEAVRFYDWGDSVVAHPFAAMLVPLGYLRRLGMGLDDHRSLAAGDAYLDVFGAFGPHEELVAALEIACRVAKVARVLTWERALRAARQQGETIDAGWARAPLETLVSLLDDAYVGGA